jgi:tRNA pseudouridine65 synthase
VARTAAATEDALPVLYRDERIVAVHKPSGLLVHRTALDSHETRFALQLLRRQLRRRVHPVHRLDKAASGALLFALDPATAAGLGKAVRARELRRTYLALVRGRITQAGTIEHPLEPRRDPAERTTGGGRREGDGRDGRAVPPAVTRYWPLASVELPHRVDRYPTTRYSLLQLEPLTGRRHQLRRHLAHLSHPIIGDTTYGNGRHNRLFRERLASERLLLACVELRLVHPATHEPLVIRAPLAAEFAGVVAALGWADAVPAPWWPGPPAS